MNITPPDNFWETPPHPTRRPDVHGTPTPTTHLSRQEFWGLIDLAWKNVERKVIAMIDNKDPREPRYKYRHEDTYRDIQRLRDAMRELSQPLLGNLTPEAEAATIRRRTKAADTISGGIFLPFLLEALVDVIYKMSYQALRDWDTHVESILAALDTPHHFATMRAWDEHDFLVKRSFIIVVGKPLFFLAANETLYVDGVGRFEGLRGLGVRTLNSREILPRRAGRG